MRCQMTTRTRLNLIGVLTALFLPWSVSSAWRLKRHFSRVTGRHRMSQMSLRFIVMFALWSFQLRYTAPGKMLGKDWSRHSFPWFDESMISMPSSFLFTLRVLAITIVLGTIVGLYCLYRAGSLAVVFRMQKVVVSERAFRVWGPTFMPSTFRPISVSWVRTESTISCVAMSQKDVLFHHFHLWLLHKKKLAGRFAVWSLFIAITAVVAFGIGMPMGSWSLRG